jgi:5'-methylthioadenosine nucleosidase
MVIKNIAVIMAMMDEAKPLIDNLILTEQFDMFHKQLPFKVFTGKIDNLNVDLIWNGIDSKYNVDNVATQPATLATYLAITNLNPDIIISAGTAGGVAKRGAEIGDIYLSCGVFRYHDRRIPYTNFPEYGVGSYPSVDVSSIARDLNFKLGEVSTGNSLELIERDFEIIESHQSVVKDMEAAAIAWVCRLLGIPMFAVKAIVDLLDGEKATHEQFSEYLSLGSSNLKQAIIDVIAYCKGKTVADLALPR